MMNEFEKSSVLYHDIFDYPPTKKELVKWKCGTSIKGITSITGITSKKGYYFLNEREDIIQKRLQNKKTSVRKIEIAKRVSKILSKIPSVEMVAVTGSLAMENSSEESDIDLMIITKEGTLWTTRLISYLVNWLIGVKTRRPDDKNQKDKLCFNMWLDESDLVWKKMDRNLYTAHEIAQIVPLINKDKIYEKFLFLNKWILNFWPHAVRIENLQSKTMKLLKTKNSRVRMDLLENIFYKIQLNYMKSKITREVVTPTRALFHPQDWGKVVLKKLSP
jgi:predicted nucleotidyltransferase